MNEEEFRSRFHRALGEPPESDLERRLPALLTTPAPRRFSIAFGSVAATLVLLLVGGLMGWRLLFQRAPARVIAKPSPIVTAAPPAVAADPSNCRLPVVVMRESGPPGELTTAVGFVDTRTGQYTADPAGTVVGLPGGAFEGTGIKPSRAAGPVYYSAPAKRWLPVNGGQVAPDGLSYVWVQLLPVGSNFSNFKAAALHRYDITSATDRTLWSYPGSIDIARWDPSGIVANTVPPMGGTQIWWVIDAITGTAAQQNPSADFSGTLTQLPGDPLLRGGFSYASFGVKFRGHTIFRIGSRDPGSPDWVLYETAPGQRVTIFRGTQGDATGFDPFQGRGDASGIWFGDYDNHSLWRWQPDSGLRKIHVGGLPSPLPGANSSLFVNPAGDCL